MSQGELFINAPDELPPQDRFPINSDGRSVGTIIGQDLRESCDPLIITGYTSLSMVIEFLASCHKSTSFCHRIRLFLGHEPTFSLHQDFRSSRLRFSQEVNDYWLDHGISILLCAKVIAAIELIDKGIVETRISRDPARPVHAKIYQTEQAATLGSSNFSQSGFYSQAEGNARFLKAGETQRYLETKQIAEHIWDIGESYNLKSLLEKLLRKVSWQEALARSCAEVLEGKWAKQYFFEEASGEKRSLWPSQEQGIAQAMWVLENVGSVLIADATGSGKTRMTAHLMRGIADHIARTGRRRRDLHTLVCPPGVRASWKEEALDCGLNITPYSSGALSQKNAREYENTMTAIHRSQILAIDEAHNYFSRTSQRTRAIFESVADYILLLTATPINRGAYDLLSVVDLLGADNLDDDVLEVLKPLWQRHGELDDIMSPLQKETLKRAIQQFTVRRTKTMLNALVAREPERYKDKNGRQCLYPRHDMKEYTCDETEEDRRISVEIREQVRLLLGLINLQRCLRLSEAQRKEGVLEEDYLRWRLQGAKGLAGYHITASLRSSRAALLEHLRGTDYAAKSLGFTASSKSQKTGGNVIQRLCDGRSDPPGHELRILVPEWLADPTAYGQACDAEIEVYQKIELLTSKLSSRREDAKASLLEELLNKHKLVLAFDHHPLTLDDLRWRLGQRGVTNVIVATGNNPAEQERLSKAFEHGSSHASTIALCSDAMSEGRNLQGASVMVHLDMPSVVRLAEQRVGRIDRMDSEYEVIQAYWPDDAVEFKLRADEKFHARHRFMADLIGSNIRVPNEIVTPQQMVEEMEKAEPWDGLEDAFAPVRHLVSGERRLVPKDVYEKIRHSTARVLSSVCAVQASRPWAFFAVAGTEWGAPRWVYLQSTADEPKTDLQQISAHLRENLTAETQVHELDENAVKLLSTFVARLIDTEKLLLPKKKQRALDEMEIVLKSYKNKAKNDKDSDRLKVSQYLLSLLDHHHNSSAIDLAKLAEQWLNVIRPVWHEHLQQRKRTGPLLLKHLRESLKHENALSNRDLDSVCEAVCPVRPLAERIVAAIIGVA